MTNLHERMFCRTGGSNPRPSEYQADAHPTELPGQPNVHLFPISSKFFRPSKMSRKSETSLQMPRIDIQNYRNFGMQSYINCRYRHLRSLLRFIVFVFIGVVNNS